MIRPISFYNTATGAVTPFVSHKTNEATMYSCGPTAYDHAHIGNMRPYIHADLIKRALEHVGYTVRHTVNITDFGHLVGDGDDGEDKIMRALRKENMPVTKEAMKALTERYTESFKQDLATMNIRPNVTYTPASAYVPEQIALIQTLFDRGYAYETSDGAYFDISRFPEYGTLGNINLEKLKSGARVEVNTEKRHAADFALWKKGDLGWSSPWGTGFPGWHIECTAMAFATLGEQIDIHTGGEDLMHTHHNGEIAQAECATDKHPYVQFWMHNAFITIDNQKIAKSVGNVIRVPELTARGYFPLALRYWLLSGHYRTTMNFTFEALDGAQEALRRLYTFLYDNEPINDGVVNGVYAEAFWDAVHDDLNTPVALATIWRMLDDNALSVADKQVTLRSFDCFLGLRLDESVEIGKSLLGIVAIETLPVEVQSLIHERENARAEKRWDDADRLRAEIKTHGFLVEDTVSGFKISILRK